MPSWWKEHSVEVASLIVSIAGLLLIGEVVLVGVNVTNVESIPGSTSTAVSSQSNASTRTQTASSTATVTVTTTRTTALATNVLLSPHYDNSLQEWVAPVGNFSRISVFVPSGAVFTGSGRIQFAASPTGPFYDAFGCNTGQPSSVCQLTGGNNLISVPVQGLYVGVQVAGGQIFIIGSTA